MKIAIVGSRNVTVSDIGKYISNAEEIVSGGICLFCFCIFCLLFAVICFFIFAAR